MGERVVIEDGGMGSNFAPANLHKNTGTWIVTA
jgi:hypothetical protein